MELIEASKKKRLINFIIDIITIVILVAITVQIEFMVDNKMPIKILRVLIIYGGCYIPMEYFFGKTVGKFVTRSRVVNRDGSKITFRTAVIRYLCRWIPFESVSLALGYDAKAWHDMLSKTYVIQESRE
ncbi:MAG: RDD family protein [Bacteroidetes bacterium]|nr:RDD family protein [Bacteroidota bacterium]